MTNITVVLDTNVLISALLIPQSLPGKIILLWQQKKFEIITSQPIVEEFVTLILRVKFSSNYTLSQSHIQILTKELINHQIKVPIPRSRVKIRDPKDIVVLATALRGHANYLVTGDKDLLVLSGHNSIKPLHILTPSEFLQEFISL